MLFSGLLAHLSQVKSLSLAPFFEGRWDRMRAWQEYSGSRVSAMLSGWLQIRESRRSFARLDVVFVRLCGRSCRRRCKSSAWRFEG